MRVTIIAEDNHINIDGVPHDCDCSGLIAKDIRAVQWYGTEGEIEYIGHKKPNAIITEFLYQELIDKATPLVERLKRIDEARQAEFERLAIENREADPATQLGHFDPSPKTFTIPEPAND